MNHFITYSTLQATDVFIPANFPEIDKEISMIKTQVKEPRNADQCAVMISFFKDHSIRVDLSRSQSPLVKILLSMTTCRYIEGLFTASKENERFRSGFEKYLSAKLAE